MIIDLTRDFIFQNQKSDSLEHKIEAFETLCLAENNEFHTALSELLLSGNIFTFN